MPGIWKFAAVALLGLVTPVFAAQKPAEEHGAPPEDSVAKRSFSLVLGSAVETVRMTWGQGDTLEEYVHSHPGRYLVFSQEGVLHRLDREPDVHAAEAAYAPMQALEARQKALAAQQRPLAEQQKALAAEMRGASTPVEMQRIGAAQGSLGRQQGEIGGKQGEIGRRQGELGRALNASVQRMIDTCLRDGSCPVVVP